MSEVPEEKLREGYKQDENKVRLDLIPMDVFLELGKLFTLGAKKYDDNNWKKGLRYGQVYAALMRHLIAFMEGETLDPDNGQHHLDSVIWNAWVLRHFELHPDRYSKFDDRPQHRLRSIMAHITESRDPSLAERSEFIDFDDSRTGRVGRNSYPIPEGYRMVLQGSIWPGDKIWNNQTNQFDDVDDELTGKDVRNYGSPVIRENVRRESKEL